MFLTNGYHNHHCQLEKLVVVNLDWKYCVCLCTQVCLPIVNPNKSISYSHTLYLPTVILISPHA